MFGKIDDNSYICDELTLRKTRKNRKTNKYYVEEDFSYGCCCGDEFDNDGRG